MSETLISIADQYSRFPAGRYPADGPYNGQRFRQEVLLPAVERAISNNDNVVVRLDGVIGYSSSFLEEVFGGIIRARPDLGHAIRKALRIQADDIAYKAAKIDAEKYLSEELSRH
jgi:hypothetical protein